LKKNIAEAVERVREMEALYDLLWQVQKDEPARLESDGELKEAFDKLIHYYTGGTWLRDYELDERGAFPAELKRGVLSQDGIYDLLSEMMK